MGLRIRIMIMASYSQPAMRVTLLDVLRITNSIIERQGAALEFACPTL